MSVYKLFDDVPGPELSDLQEKLRSRGQSHLLRFWPDLPARDRASLRRELDELNLEELSQLLDDLVHGAPEETLDIDQARPAPVIRLPRTDAERADWRRAREIGAAMLANGQVAVLLVAGGQGTRLGFDGPKGTFPIGPVTGASLFQIHAEKILAMSRRHGKNIPLYVMTSPANHEATLRFFHDHANFNLEHVRFFQQAQMPAVDRETGRILLSDKGKLALSPDGHGGSLTALKTPGPGNAPSCLDEMREAGITTVFYLQVDNPMVKMVDPAFLGLHHRAEADVSFKVVEKVLPGEKVGVVVTLQDSPKIIEYSDLPRDLGERRLPDGSLEFWAGSIGIHLFQREFLESIGTGARNLPYHRALKKVPFLAEDGRTVQPSRPNAVKFERFVFDTLPLADRWCIVETDRCVEFEPLKNATGSDSPASVRMRMSELFAGWLDSAGAIVARDDGGSVPFGIEISPLFALDAADLKRSLPPGMVIEGPLYLGPLR